jgi:glucose/arabinose dehydrogenase
MTNRLALPTRRNHSTRKVKIARQRTLYISVHDDTHPAEVFHWVKGADCSSELIGLST